MAEVSTTQGQLLYGKVLTPKGLIEQGVIAVSNEQIHYAGEAKYLPEHYASWSADGQGSDELLIPGFIDVHVHGGAGHNFMYSDAEALNEITKFHSSNGTTTMLATTMTADKSAIDKVFTEINDYRAKEMPYTQIAGMHLEGPFISPKWSGAQNPEHIVPAN